MQQKTELRPAQQLWSTLLPIALGWAFLFRNEFASLWLRLNTEDFSYCLLAPFLAGYFVWKDRDRLAENLGGKVWQGYAAIVCAALLYFMGAMGSLETLSYVSLWLSLVGIALVLCGWRSMRTLAFPALILLFIVPPPAFIERSLSFNLRLASSAAATELLNLLSVPVFREGNIIDLGQIRLQVVDACSGLRYFLPTVLLSLVAGKMFNTSFFSRLILLLSSAPISLGLNTLRLAVTGILVRYVSPTMADGFFHDFQGWAIYLCTVVLLVGLSLFLRLFERQPVSTPTTGVVGAEEAEIDVPLPEPIALGQRFAAAFPGLKTALGVALLLVSVSLGARAVVSSQIIPEWRSFEDFPMEIGQWEGVRSYLDKATLDSLWADDYVMATYRHKVSGQELYLLVPYYRMQTSQHTAHAPTSCLLGSGWDLTSKKQLAASPATGRPFPVQQLVLSDFRASLLSNFWFQQRGRLIANEFSNKILLLWDALTMRRTDGALVRIEMPLLQGQSVDDAQRVLDEFTGQTEVLLRNHIPR